MDELPNKRQRFGLTGIKQVRMTGSKKRFDVHEDLIATSSSKLLKDTLLNIQDDDDATLILRPGSTAILEGYLRWLYTERLLPQLDEDFNYRELLELYQLGVYLQDLKFRLVVVNEIISYSYRINSLPCILDLEEVWTQPPPPDCSLRKIIKEMLLAQPVGNTIQVLRAAEGRFTRSFILDLFEELVEGRQDLKNVSFSGKTCAEIETACRKFAEDANDNENA